MYMNSSVGTDKSMMNMTRMAPKEYRIPYSQFYEVAYKNQRKKMYKRRKMKELVKKSRINNNERASVLPGPSNLAARNSKSILKGKSSMLGTFKSGSLQDLNLDGPKRSLDKITSSNQMDFSSESSSKSIKGLIDDDLHLEPEPSKRLNFIKRMETVEEEKTFTSKAEGKIRIPLPNRDLETSSFKNLSSSAEFDGDLESAIEELSLGSPKNRKITNNSISEIESKKDIRIRPRLMEDIPEHTFEDLASNDVTPKRAQTRAKSRFDA